MLANQFFMGRPSEFWALVKYASQTLGYSNKGVALNYNVQDVRRIAALMRLPQAVANDATDYMNYRSDVLQTVVQPSLMTRVQAEAEFLQLRAAHNPTCSLPMNKQRGALRHYNFLSCIVNILTEANIKSGTTFDDNPRKLPIIKNQNGRLVFTMSRWPDGAYPSLDNPISMWEVKEYYGTKTFGSRVADGIYETQLDGYEILNAQRRGNVKIFHYLLVDAVEWWIHGIPFLVRLVDISHMQLVDEVLFGREVLVRWPQIVQSW